MKVLRKATRRSPLDRKPLHNPGESLHRQREELVDDEFTSTILFAVVMAVAAVWEWARWYFNAPPSPVLLTGMALLAVAFAIYRLWRLRQRVRLLRLGEDGEKEVGHCLEDLRSQGCRVFHDIEGQGFNIDHLVISRRGIFVIETKTYSKPLRGQTVVTFDGERLLVNGRSPARNPVVQVQALRRWVRKLLADTTGRQFLIKGVIVFPGWYVPDENSNGEVWVLNPKRLPVFIGREPIQLPLEDVALVSSRISDYVQGVEK